MGIVQAMGNVPQEDPGMTRTAPGGNTPLSLNAFTASDEAAGNCMSKPPVNFICDLPAFHSRTLPAGISHHWSKPNAPFGCSFLISCGAADEENTRRAPPGYFTSSPPRAFTTTFPSPAS